MIKAVIFDMDGVISDTQVLHAGAISTVLAKHGVKITPDDVTRRFGGVKVREVFTILAKESVVTLKDLGVLVDEYFQQLMAVSQGHVQAVPGTLEFIDMLIAKKISVGLASSSGFEYIDLVLKELRLAGKFQSITSGQEVSRGKPAPDIFLLVAKRIGVAPENCLVIEDSVSGMIAAKNAGMKCVGLVRRPGGGEYPADVIVDNLKKLDMYDIII